jgi:hypothetical protein
MKISVTAIGAAALLMACASISMQDAAMDLQPPAPSAGSR